MPHRCLVAEYLRLRAHFDEADHALLAELLSLTPVAPAPRRRDTPAAGVVSGRGAPSASTPPASSRQDYPERIPLLPFVRHLGSKPHRAGGASATRVDTTEAATTPSAFVRQRRPVIALQLWEALWPFLKRVLAQANPTASIDIPRLVADISAARPLRQIPLARAPAWPQRVVVIVDHSEHLVPLREDFLRIVEHLRQWFSERIRLLLLEDAERRGFKEPTTGGIRHYPDLPRLSGNDAVLVLGDLGMAHPRRWSRLNWREWGQRLAGHRAPPLALIPAHPGDWDSETARHYHCAWLDHAAKLQLQRPAPVALDIGTRLQALLTLLAPMSRITPALLRQARIQHPDRLDVSVEIAFWGQPGFGCVNGYREWRNADLRRHYLEELASRPALHRLAQELLEQHEKSLPLRLQIQQKQTFARIQALPLDAEQARYLAHIAATMEHLDPLERHFLDNWLARLETEKGETAWFDAIEPLYRQYYRQLPPREQRAKSPPEPTHPRAWRLELHDSLEGPRLALVVPGQTKTSVPGHNRLASFEAAGPVVARGYQDHRRLFQQTLQPGEALTLPETPSYLTIDTGHGIETIDWPTRPSWASSIGRDRHGLFAEVQVNGVGFVLRWIPPGEFLIGSPEDEPGRYGDEGPQHRVRFAQGFWLAETACTQALWRAVTGENPSRFKGDDRPVENVSWNDVQAFLQQLNTAHPGLALRLPSEAEWEYACRAGTETPFWFGAELTTDRANYGRGETVPVKHFQPNPWGLYQVHGNVWEWCQDRWHYSYQGAPEDGQPWETGGDPEEAVLRGGSWIGLGGGLRSAYRARDHRDHADFVALYGFRLARGPELQPDQPVGADAASRRKTHA